MAAQYDWYDEKGERPPLKVIDRGDARAEDAYRVKVGRQEDRAERRRALFAELAEGAEQIVAIARRNEPSRQHIALARTLVREAEKALRALEAE